jgi:phosphohistidine phosphatase
MKKLIIVRHSKSSWKDHSLLDFDRPLNKRGNEDGKKMSKLLKKYISSVDLLISSSSKRTRLTSSYFQKEIQFENSLFTKNYIMLRIMKL